MYFKLNDSIIHHAIYKYHTRFDFLYIHNIKRVIQFNSIQLSIKVIISVVNFQFIRVYYLICFI